jgi:hypothetical protein
MTDSADHVTGKTGLTLTITASKDGAAFASISPTVTELSNGWYNLALTSSHTDTLGDLALHVTGAGADPTDLVMQVVAYDWASASSLGLSNLDATVSSRAPSATALSTATWTNTRAGNLDNLDTTVSSRLPTSSYTAPDNTTINTINTKIGTPANTVSADVAAVKNDTGTILPMVL